MFDVAYVSIFDVLCISVLMLNISLRLAGLNIYFCLFLAKKWVQNWVHRNGFFFLLWDWLKMRQVAPFYTTSKLRENYHVSRIMFRKIVEVILNFLRILCRGSSSSGFVCFGSTNNKFFSFLPIFSFCSNVRERMHVMCRD